MKPIEMRDDKDLLKRISRRDKAAMGVLYERYQTPLCMQPWRNLARS
jgi:hypothetical protein